MERLHATVFFAYDVRLLQTEGGIRAECVPGTRPSFESADRPPLPVDSKIISQTVVRVETDGLT